MSRQIQSLAVIAALGLLISGCGGESDRPSSKSDPAGNTVQRDVALAGTWTQSSSYTSGEYGFATREILNLRGDGSWQLMDSRVVGGGPGAGIDSGAGAGVQAQGQWQTQDRVLYVNEGNGWVGLAEYYIEGHKMLLKLADGSREVWYRQ
ncbi:MAG: hypothetical protein ACR2NP_02490 [Pirellulaceae bacterium]